MKDFEVVGYADLDSGEILCTDCATHQDNPVFAADYTGEDCAACKFPLAEDLVPETKSWDFLPYGLVWGEWGIHGVSNRRVNTEGWSVLKKHSETWALQLP